MLVDGIIMDLLLDVLGLQLVHAHIASDFIRLFSMSQLKLAQFA
jgi:hypothetical protein